MRRFSVCLRISILLVLAVFLTSCLETSLIYDMNTYHDGRTLGKGRASGQVFLSEVATFETTKDEGFETGVHDWLDIGMGGRIGIAQQADIGGQLYTGLGERFGGRMYVKVRLNNPEERLAIALMPAAGFAIGDRDVEEETGSELSSHMFTAELHMPMSYDMTRHFRWIFGSHIYYFNYRAPFTAGTLESPNLRSQTVTRDYFCPAISGGFRYGPVTPEVTFMLIDSKARAFVGLGMNF